MVRTLLCSTVAAFAVSAGAFAQDDSAYFNLGYTYLDADGANYNMAALRAGAEVNEFFGVEGELLVGLGSHSSGGVSSKVRYGAGLFGRFNAPASDGFTLFARLGIIYMDMEACAGGICMSDNDTGWAGGVGAEMRMDRYNAFRLEYTRYEPDGSADGFGVSYVRRF